MEESGIFPAEIGSEGAEKGGICTQILTWAADGSTDYTSFRRFIPGERRLAFYSFPRQAGGYIGFTVSPPASRGLYMGTGGEFGEGLGGGAGVEGVGGLGDSGGE